MTAAEMLSSKAAADQRETTAHIAVSHNIPSKCFQVSALCECMQFNKLDCTEMRGHLMCYH